MSALRTAGGRWRLAGRRPAAVAACTLAAAGLAAGGVLAAAGPAVAAPAAAPPAVTATIPVGSDPQGAAVNALAGAVYVANAGSNTVSVINAKTNAVTATIGVGNVPLGVAVSPLLFPRSEMKGRVQRWLGVSRLPQCHRRCAASSPAGTRRAAPGA